MGLIEGGRVATGWNGGQIVAMRSKEQEWTLMAPTDTQWPVVQH